MIAAQRPNQVHPDPLVAYLSARCSGMLAPGVCSHPPRR